ncbi:MAG TPA: DUF1707 domain-containing protein [Acidimicrobiales bacterium]|nr:DUF1707 domain-containing protein [Acidimicrobiales bacterium]
MSAGRSGTMMGTVPGSTKRRDLRASDADRDAAVDELRRHASVGRLTIDELDERIGRALRSKTLGELEDLLADLPVEPPEPVVPRPQPLWTRPAVRAAALRLGALDLFCVLAWALSGHPVQFWPAWVILFSVWRLGRTSRNEARREEAERRRALATAPPRRRIGPP